MKFTLTATNFPYHLSMKKEIKIFEKLGFEFESTSRGKGFITPKDRCIEIELNSLEEVLNLIYTSCCPIVLSESRIEIYNDYRE